MSAVLNAIFPVFALIFLGWWVARKNILDHNAAHVLTRYVALIALPALLFNISVSRPWYETLHWGVIVSFGIPMMACFALAFYLRLRNNGNRASASLAGMNASYANTGFMGIPLLSLLIGEASLTPAVTTTLLTATLLFSITVAIISSAASTTETASAPLRAWRISLTVLRNPLAFAPLAGIILSVYSVPIPLAVNNVLDLLAAPAAPTALFAIGLFLATIRHPTTSNTDKDNNLLLSILGIKLLLQPLLAGLLAYYALDLPPYWAFSVTLLSATPLGSGPFMLANLYQQNSDTTAKLILYSTLLSIITLSLMVNILPY